MSRQADFPADYEHETDDTSKLRAQVRVDAASSNSHYEAAPEGANDEQRGKSTDWSVFIPQVCTLGKNIVHFLPEASQPYVSHVLSLLATRESSGLIALIQGAVKRRNS